MEIKAAILRESAKDFELTALELGDLRSDEVLVRMVATGVCHTDLIMAGRPLVPKPIVLGHEGAGVVERVGDSVETIKAGDHVVLSVDACGDCSFCRTGKPTYCRMAQRLNFASSRLDGSTALSEGGRPVHSHFFGQSSFGSYAIASERNAIKVDPDLPLEILGPLGCGIQTGAGSVLNALKPPLGSSIAVFGVGSVGLSAVMAAVIAGCSTIIAVDINRSRLDVAKQMGATDVIDATSAKPGEEIRRITGGTGSGYAFLTSGDPSSMQEAIQGLDTLGVCGFVAAGGETTFSPSAMLWGRSLRGIIEGDAIPKLFIPQLIELWRQGRFPFDKLISYFPFDRINEAAEASLSGGAIKPVLRFS
jgi:aryl-alcohol dehydrogenase